MMYSEVFVATVHVDTLQFSMPRPFRLVVLADRHYITYCDQLAGSEEDMACQPEPQSTNTLPSNDGTQEELQAREEAVQLALAKLSPYLYTSTYKTDFWERGESGAYR